MESIFQWPHFKPVAGLVAVVGAMVILAWRVRETQRPVNARKILFPPLGMATGFSMFFVPALRVPWSWGAGAFLTGALLLAIPLRRTSKLTLKDGAIYLQRSRAFLAILVGLVIVRYAAKSYFEERLGLSVERSAALFFLLAFGMIVRWRLGMFLQFRRLSRELASSTPNLERAA